MLSVVGAGSNIGILVRLCCALCLTPRGSSSLKIKRTLSLLIMKPFIRNFWQFLALYPKYRYTLINIINAKTSLIELFGVLCNKPNFFKIHLN